MKAESMALSLWRQVGFLTWIAEVIWNQGNVEQAPAMLVSVHLGFAPLQAKAREVAWALALPLIKKKGESCFVLLQTISKVALNPRVTFILSVKNGILGWIKWAHTTTRKAFSGCDLCCEDKEFSCLFLKAKGTLLILLWSQGSVVWRYWAGSEPAPWAGAGL